MRVTPVREQAVYLFKGASACGRLYVVIEGQREDLGTHVVLGDYWCVGRPVRAAGLQHGRYAPGQEKEHKVSKEGRRTGLGCAKKTFARSLPEVSALTRRKPHRHHGEHHFRLLRRLSEVPRGVRATDPYRTRALRSQSAGVVRQMDTQRRKLAAC